MKGKTYKIIELVGTSAKSVEDAVEAAISSAASDHANYSWFEVIDVRGHIKDGKVAYYQVTVKLGRSTT